MKKKLIALVTIVSIIAVAAVAFAAKGVTVWQCDKCGAQRTLTGNTLPSSNGCGGVFTNRHVWRVIARQ
ncbi:MAG: hypothetical protein E7197_08790 [Anaerovibrio sp.]|uniref:hypothetical protein n=1 Tax=Anaerovibrio sp. TaxID=1872532 RepID=UPI0025C0EFE5|nr:hypothetical protein [Anaerovibrio sp.]MBE6100134.1 hypothetical protein [Anaerovibrio sp.]